MRSTSWRCGQRRVRRSGQSGWRDAQGPHKSGRVGCAPLSQHRRTQIRHVCGDTSSIVRASDPELGGNLQAQTRETSKSANIERSNDRRRVRHIAFFHGRVRKTIHVVLPEGPSQEGKDLSVAQESLWDPRCEPGVRDVRGGGTQQSRFRENRGGAMPVLERSAGGPTILSK